MNNAIDTTKIAPDRILLAVLLNVERKSITQINTPCSAPKSIIIDKMLFI